MAGDGVQVLGADQTMQALTQIRSVRPSKLAATKPEETNLDESVVQQEHDGGQIPCDFRVPEEGLANVTHVADIWVTQAKLPKSVISTYLLKKPPMVIPDSQRGIQHHRRDEHGQDQARNETQDGIGPGKRHDRKTDILGEQQRGRLDRIVSLAAIQLLENNLYALFSFSWARMRLRRTFCQLQVRYLMEFPASNSICLPTSSPSDPESMPLGC